MTEGSSRLQRRRSRGKVFGVFAGEKVGTTKNMGPLERLFWWACLLAGIVALSAWVPEVLA